MNVFEHICPHVSQSISGNSNCFLPDGRNSSISWWPEGLIRYYQKSVAIIENIWYNLHMVLRTDLNCFFTSGLGYDCMG